MSPLPEARFPDRSYGFAEGPAVDPATLPPVFMFDGTRTRTAPLMATRLAFVDRPTRPGPFVAIEGKLLGRNLRYRARDGGWFVWWGWGRWRETHNDAPDRAGFVDRCGESQDFALHRLAELVKVEPADVFEFFPFGFEVIVPRLAWGASYPDI